MKNSLEKSAERKTSDRKKAVFRPSNDFIEGAIAASELLGDKSKFLNRCVELSAAKVLNEMRADSQEAVERVLSSSRGELVAQQMAEKALAGLAAAQSASETPSPDEHTKASSSQSRSGQRGKVRR